MEISRILLSFVIILPPGTVYSLAQDKPFNAKGYILSEPLDQKKKDT
jgi:hypothetical protein